MTKENKEKLCHFIISQYAYDNKKSIEEISSKDIYGSTKLGIALQYLGKTDDWNQEDFDYIESRAGVMELISYNGREPYILTLRDILED